MAKNCGPDHHHNILRFLLTFFVSIHELLSLAPKFEILSG
jgi:hypothetical protein